MVLLNVHVSNFHLHSSTPFSPSTPILLHLRSTTRRICGVESPATTPSSTPRRTHDLFFPSSWSLSWTERLPDRLAQSAAALHFSAYASPKKSSKLLACAPRKRVQLGELVLDFLHLATGTVCRAHSLLSPATGEPTQYTLSFDIKVEEVARLALSFAHLTLNSRTPTTHAHPYKLAIDHIGGRTVEASCISSIQHLQQQHSPTSSERRSSNASSSDREEPEDISPNDLRCPALPPLSLHASNLHQLAHGSLRIRLSKADSTVAQASVQVHELWAAIAHPSRPFSLRLPLSDDVTLLASVSTDRPPPTGQMVGGVTTDLGVTGAKPVIFGSVLPDVPHVSQTDEVPDGWVTLVDTFGYTYYHNWKNGVDVWTRPPDETISEAVRHDELRALERGYERAKYGVFKCQDDASETWIHPAASRSSFPSYAAPDNDIVQPDTFDMDTFNSLSTFDMSELHPAAFTRITTQEPSTNTEHPRDGAIVEHKDVPRGRIVEMMWDQMPSRRYPPGPELEGYTLTAVNRGKTLLKFGGSTGSGGRRMNVLHSYDVQTGKWREPDVSGVLPAARTGHGAVALGTDLSRLLIFGGSSPQGRRNDLHMFHVANKTWSPVTCTGTPPEVRARMGMTVTSDGSTALVFGGRSLYRYLGGRNYDSLYVNAFHAERSEWVQMRPEGTGPRPSPRSGCVVEFVNGRHMLVHGGYDDGRDRYFDDTFLFDMVSSSWQRIDSTPVELRPQARESHLSAMLDGKMFIYGGDSKTGLLADMHIFDSGVMRWTEGPSQVGHGPGKMCGGGMAALDSKSLLVVGGDSGFKMSRTAYKLNVSRRSTIDADGMVELARERGPDADMCVVCLDARTDTMFLWCGHSVCCRMCSRLVKGVCPVCRQPFSKVVKGGFGEGAEEIVV